MKARSWAWVGAKVIGTSHQRAHSRCDDFGACIEATTPYGDVLIGVVSDGAGSASHSYIGSRIVCSQFIRSARDFVRAGNYVGNITESVAECWLDDIRDYISQIAHRERQLPREFAATMVATVIGPTESVILHIGDGAVVVKCNDDDSWTIPAWPMQGDYASTTYFVTDDALPKLQYHQIDDRVQSVALFTDGLERLALDFKSRTPFEPFFGQMIRPLVDQPSGRSRYLSQELVKFLGSEAVNERTDDDKTLILAHRYG